MAPAKRKSEEKIQEETKEGKQNKPVRERAKGIVINEVQTKSETEKDTLESTARKGIAIKEVPTKSETEKDTAESTAKKGTKRKKEYVVKSLYSLRSGRKGPGVDVDQEFEKKEAEKGKEKETEVSETDSNEVCKKAKNDDDSDDSDGDGDGGGKSKYKSLLGLKLDLTKAAEELKAAGFRVIH